MGAGELEAQIRRALGQSEKDPANDPGWASRLPGMNQAIGATIGNAGTPFNQQAGAVLSGFLSGAQQPILDQAPIYHTPLGAPIDMARTAVNTQIGETLGDYSASKSPGFTAAEAINSAGADDLADAASSAKRAQQDAMGSYLGQQLASASADYQGNLADFALQRALLGDQSANSKQGLQLSAAKQRELLDYQLKTGQRVLGLINQDRGLIEAGKGFAGRELDLNKALRDLQHQSVGLNRKDIDLSDRNIELDRADILTKYNADRRHANQAATAGGSWFAPERMLTQKDLYSNLMTNAGRLDTRWQHNNLNRGGADLEDLTINNNAGRDQLGYDRSMNDIERALLANTQKANSVGDQSFSAQVNRNYLDPILANQLGGVDLGYRRGLLPIQTGERQSQQQYNDALAAWYAWAASGQGGLGALTGTMGTG